VAGILFVNQRLQNISISWRSVYKKKWILFSDSYSGEVKHWYIWYQSDYCWFGLQKSACSMGAVLAYARNEERGMEVCQ